MPDGETRIANLLGVSATGPLLLEVSGERVEVDIAPANAYSSHLQVAAIAGAIEPLLDVCFEDSTFHALLNSGAGVFWEHKPWRLHRLVEAGRRRVSEHFTLLLVGHIVALRCAARSARPAATRGTASCSCQSCAETLYLEETF